MNAQFETLKAKLRERGASLACINQVRRNERSQYEEYLISMPGQAHRSALFILYDNGGYLAFYMLTGNEIAGDVDHLTE